MHPNLAITLCDCADTLTVFETKDSLYRFNSGWLFNDATTREERDIVNRNLTQMRVENIIKKVIEDEVGNGCVKRGVADIGPMIVLIPILLLVIPPMLGAISILFLWKKRRNEEDGPKVVLENNLSRKGSGSTARKSKDTAGSSEDSSEMSYSKDAEYMV